LFGIADKNRQTVLMVAHRLETAVMYCEKIMVLERGELADFDKPLKLLVNDVSDDDITRTDSLFAEMVRALAPSQQSKILRICKQKYFDL